MTSEERAMAAYRAWEGAPVTGLFALIAEQIRAAVEAERERCARVVENNEECDPYSVGPIVAQRIRAG